MRHHRRNEKQEALTYHLHRVASRLAEQHSTATADFRYVTIRFFDGRQWMLEERWERKVGGVWQVVEWTEFDY